MDEYIDNQISLFFLYWRKRTKFIENLIENSPRENSHEIHVLIWAALDALSNLWAESEIGNKRLTGRVRFDAFLSQYGGEIFQKVSLPNIWFLIETKSTIIVKSNADIPAKRLPEEVCEYLRFYKRPELDYESLGPLDFSWQRSIRNINDDLKLDELLLTLINKFPELEKEEENVKRWLKWSRYGSLLYKEMRSQYIHYGRQGERAGFGLVYSSSQTIGLAPQTMLNILNQCINHFEREAIEKECDPYPSPYHAVEHYSRKLLENLLVYQFGLDNSKEELLNEIEVNRRKLLGYKNTRKYLEKIYSEVYLRLRSNLKYQCEIYSDLPRQVPYTLDNILNEQWVPDKNL